MTITRVGFGAWAIGGGGWAFAWGDQDDQQSLAAMRYAIERGVNWIDTAAVYGLGHSEALVRTLLRDIPQRERPYVFTKCGLIWNDQDRAATPLRIGRPESLRRELEASLRRLGVEQIDLYQVHWPAEDGTPLDVYWQTLVDMKREGKVRAIGLSNHSVEQLERAEHIGHVDTLQPPFSLIRRNVAGAELPWCDTHGTGVIVYSPMQSGLLTGSFSEARAAELSRGDWRSRSPEFQPPNLQRNLALVDALRPLAVEHQTSVGAIAVAWTLANAAVTAAIVGARNPAQVDGWIDAADIELTAAELQYLADAVRTTGAGTGPIESAQ
jgi:aryl-alcohol dehydrogenase-like predicted oxidoreductase